MSAKNSPLARRARSVFASFSLRFRASNADTNCNSTCSGKSTRQVKVRIDATRKQTFQLCSRRFEPLRVRRASLWPPRLCNQLIEPSELGNRPAAKAHYQQAAKTHKHEHELELWLRFELEALGYQRAAGRANGSARRAVELASPKWNANRQATELNCEL